MISDSRTDATIDLTAQRNRALVPFSAFLVLIIGAYFTLKVDQINRPVPKPVDEAAMEQGGQEAGKEAEPPPAGPMTGKQAVDFDLPAVGGGRVKLSDYKGKLVFLNIWATWCAPCREEMPSMERLKKALEGTDFQMVAISVDPEGEAVVGPFVKELGLTFPVLLDPEKKDTTEYKPHGVAKNYMITGVPETYLIRPDGLVMLHLVGPTQWDRPEIVDFFKRLTAEIKNAPK